jgi:hypothetical protein
VHAAQKQMFFLTTYAPDICSVHHKWVSFSECVCVLSCSPVQGFFAYDGVSTHRPVLSPHLEAALNKIKILSHKNTRRGAFYC